MLQYLTQAKMMVSLQTDSNIAQRSNLDNAARNHPYTMPRTRRRRQQACSPIPARGGETGPSGEQYLGALIAKQERADTADKTYFSDVEDVFEDGGSVLLVAMDPEHDLDDVSNNLSNEDDCEIDSANEHEVDKHTDLEEKQAKINWQQQGGTQGNDTPTTAFAANPAHDNPSSSDHNGIDGVGSPKVKGRSIAHHLFKQNKRVLISLDIETEGENCGITQLSAKIIRPEQGGGVTTKDKQAGPV